MARGHEVTLFATADSATTATLVGTAPAGYEEDPSLDAKVWEGLHNAAVFERADRFDVIANHFDFMPLTYSRLVDTPMVTTVHGFSSPAILPVYQRYDDIAHYVSISDADRSPLLGYAATIHHGIELAPLHVRPRARRIPAVPRPDPPRQGNPPCRSRSPARPASRSSSPGSCRTRTTSSRMVRPHVDGEAVRYLGPVGPAERDALLGGATALLHLIDFDEPFGLSVVEALATGTPVIASPRGSLPELLRPGVTGFLVARPHRGGARRRPPPRDRPRRVPGGRRDPVQRRAHGRRLPRAVRPAVHWFGRKVDRQRFGCGGPDARAARSSACADHRIDSTACGSGEAGDVGQPHQGLDADGAADGERQGVDAGVGELVTERVRRPRRSRRWRGPGAAAAPHERWGRRPGTAEASCVARSRSRR